MILKPAYVDPESQYRYYTFSHMRIVEAIQYCAELDIPLKQFGAFLLEKDGQIDYSKLIDYGVKLTNQKMQRIQKRLSFLENVQQKLLHAEACCSNPAVKTYFPEKLCWAIPYEGTQAAADFHSAVYRLIANMESHGLRAGYNNGQLLIGTQGDMKSYLFIDIRETDREIEAFPQILHIPAGEYLCKVSKESNIRKAPEIFAELFEQSYDKVVIEVELFSEKFHYATPYLKYGAACQSKEKSQRIAAMINCNPLTLLMLLRRRTLRTKRFSETLIWIWLWIYSCCMVSTTSFLNSGVYRSFQIRSFPSRDNLCMMALQVRRHM